MCNTTFDEMSHFTHYMWPGMMICRIINVSHQWPGGWWATQSICHTIWQHVTPALVGSMLFYKTLRYLDILKWTNNVPWMLVFDKWMEILVGARLVYKRRCLDSLCLSSFLLCLAFGIASLHAQRCLRGEVLPWSSCWSNLDTSSCRWGMFTRLGL